MDVLELIRLLQAVAFVGAALAAAWQWYRQRTRPAAYLAAAFGAIGAVLVLTRAAPEAADLQPWFTAVVFTALVGFPWLLAAFAWSFGGPLPRWLRLAGLAIPALAGWATTLPTMVGTDEPRTPGQATFLATFLVLWSVLAVAMAGRLWRAGGRQRLVRARMRLMATGAVLLTLTLVVSAAIGPDSGPVADGLTAMLSLVSVALFVAGFAPPLPLRLWWRRRSTSQFQDLQVALIATASPEGVATAVAPLLADLLGGGAAVVDETGRILAAAQMDDDEADEIAGRLLTATPLPADTSAYPVADAWLVVRSTPYTPVFGQDELELVSAFSLHLRLALERAQLYRDKQAALDETQAAREELESTLYGLSHDLKSPTVAISGFVELLPQAAGEAQRDEMLGHIKASATYLHELVDSLLELSRIGHTQLEVVPVDLGATVAKVAERVQVAHPGLRVRVEGPLPTVSMNPVRAGQLFDNLLVNAARHGGRADIEVTIGAVHHDDWVELTVTDDGAGIPPGERERVFELFQRGSTSGERGSGVGLGMVRRIVETCGGTLDLVDSARGARFVIRLPASLLVEPTPTPGA